MVLRLFQVIFLRLTLVLKSGETRNKILKGFLKETLIYIELKAGKSLKP